LDALRNRVPISITLDEIIVLLCCTAEEAGELLTVHGDRITLRKAGTWDE
jgi:hypothetical protein